MARPTPDPDPALKDGKSPDFVQRGKVLIVRRQFQEAVKVCRLGLLAHPTYVEGRLVLGMALMALARFDEVLAEMRVALELAPRNAIAYQLKGEALFFKHDVAQAKEVLLKAQELDPQNDKVRKLLEELEDVLDYVADAAPRMVTETRVYPAQRAQALVGTREPQEVLAEVRPVEPGLDDSTVISDAPPTHDTVDEADDGSTEPDPLVDQIKFGGAAATRREERYQDEPDDEDDDEGEGDEYTTAPFLPPTQLAGGGRSRSSGSEWDDQTLSEPPPDQVEDPLHTKDTVEAEAREVLIPSSSVAGGEAGPLVGFRTAPSQPGWQSAPPLAPVGTEKEAISEDDDYDDEPTAAEAPSARPAPLDDDDYDDEPTANERPPSAEPGLGVLFPSVTGQERMDAAARHEQETAVNADAPPPLFPDPSRGAGRLWSVGQPRSSGEPTRAVDLEERGTEDSQRPPEAVTRTPAPLPLPRLGTAPASEAAPDEVPLRVATEALGASPSDLSAEISVEMLPDEMPPLPVDASASAVMVLPEASDPAETRVHEKGAAREEEDEFATRVNFDPAEDAASAALTSAAPIKRSQPAPAAAPEPDGFGVAPDPLYQSDSAVDPSALAPEPSYQQPTHYRAPQPHPSYEDEEERFDARPLQPEPSYDEPAPAGLQQEPSYGDPPSYDEPAPRRLQPEPSYDEPDEPQGGGLSQQVSYGEPLLDAFAAPAHIVDAPGASGEHVAFEPAPPKGARGGGRQAASESDEEWRFEPRESRPRTAALEDQGRAFPYLESQPSRETSPEKPKVIRQAESRRHVTDPDGSSDVDLFKARAPTRPPESRRRRQTHDRTSTSFLTLLMGDPGSHRGVYLLVGAVLVLATAVGIGLLVRYKRLGELIEAKRSQANVRVRLGNLADYNAAARSYADILSRRPKEPRALWAHARIQAAIPFEFGDPNPAGKPPAESDENNEPDRLAAEIYAALSGGALDRAVELTRKARELRPQSALILYLEGRVRLLQGNAPDAERSLEAATSLDTSEPLILRGLGEAIATQRRSVDAKDAYNRALKINPAHVASLLGLARVLLAEGALPADVQRELNRIGKHASHGQRGWADLIQAELFYRQGQLENAKAALNQAVANAPTADPTFHDDMARLLIENLQLGLAQKAVEDSKRTMPGRPQPFYHQAQIHLKNGMPGPALKQLDQAKSLGFAASAVLRAQIYLQLGQLRDAEIAVQQALSLSGELLEAYVVRARILAAQNDRPRAIQLLQSLIRKNPNSAELLTALGEVFMAEGDRERARLNFRLALKQDRNAVEAQLRLAQLLELDGKWLEAKRSLEDARRTSYGNIAVHKELARLEADSGDLGEAVSNHQHVLARVPNDSGTRLALVRVLTLQRELNVAEAELKKAEGGQPDVVALARARLALARGKPALALRDLEVARRVPRPGPEVWDLLVRAHLDAQDERAARRTAQEMVAALPGSPDAELAIARVDFAGGQLAGASRHLHAAVQALNRQPRPPVLRAEILVLLGRAHQDSGNAQAAHEEFQRAAAICPLCSDAHFYRALLLDERGNPEEALRALEQTVRFDPKRAEAYYWLGLIRERQGQTPQARDAYQKCLALNPSEDHRAAAKEALDNLKQK